MKKSDKKRVIDHFCRFDKKKLGPSMETDQSAIDLFTFLKFQNTTQTNSFLWQHFVFEYFCITLRSHSTTLIRPWNKKALLKNCFQKKIMCVRRQSRLSSEVGTCVCVVCVYALCNRKLNGDFFLVKILIDLFRGKFWLNHGKFMVTWRAWTNTHFSICLDK